MENVGNDPLYVHGSLHGPGYSGKNVIGSQLLGNLYRQFQAVMDSQAVFVRQMVNHLLTISTSIESCGHLVLLLGQLMESILQRKHQLIHVETDGPSLNHFSLF